MKLCRTTLWKSLFLSLLIIALAGCTATFSAHQLATSNASPEASAGEEAHEAQRADSEAECASPASNIPGACATESALAAVVQYLTFFAELCGALVIGVAAVRGLLHFLPHMFSRQGANETYTEDIRLQIGKSLALALEFELGADILKTAVAPSFTIIAQLAAIAVLRTFLNYFLEQELRKAEQRRVGQRLAGGAEPAEPHPSIRGDTG